MSFGEILSTLLIGPLQLLFETIFTIVDRLVQNPGLSIVALSLAMNFLVLPFISGPTPCRRKNGRRN